MTIPARNPLAVAILLVALAAGVDCIDGIGAREDSRLEEARQAFMRHELGEAREALLDALDGELAPDERAEAERTLATLAWRYQRDPETGRARLDRALAAGEERSESFAERARLETSFERFDAARAAADSALATAVGGEDSARAVARFAAAALEEERVGGGGRPHLARALERTAPFVEDRPEPIELARYQIETALRMDDGPAALAGWRAYYATSLDREGPLPAAHRDLARVLPEWAGPDASPADRRAVVGALAASGLYREALLVAVDPRATNPEFRENPEIASIVAYAEFLRRIEETTDAYYRRTALGDGDPEAWRAALIEAAGALWPMLAWEGEPPPFDPRAALPELADRFGAEVRLGTTAGYEDLHYGHVVIDDRRTIEQYGHAAELRFVALDGIVSNGFQSWAWDGRAAHGGWATDDAMIQVRPRYAEGSLQAWREITDPVERAEWEEETAEQTAADWRRAEKDRCAYLPGLQERIHHQGLLRLRDSLAAGGLSGDTLRDAFLLAYDRARVESSIFAHEGRHAIDRRLLDDDVDADEGEFRGKLSEVVFAPVPRLALQAIISPDAGDDTPHGRANERILCALVDWMEEHAGEIEGFERERPLLPQLTRLTDDQLRAAFRSLDPLAAKRR